MKPYPLKHKKTIGAFLGTALLLAALPACSTNTEPIPVNSSSSQVKLIEAVLQNGTVNQADVDSLTASLEVFASKLFEQVSKEQSAKANVFISPTSIEQVLILLLAATDGKVNSQIRNTLGVTLPDDKLYPAVAQLWKKLNRSEKGYTLENVNRGLINEMGNIKLNPEYEKLTKEYLGAEFSQMSFDDPEKVADLINGQINQLTHGMIDKLITADMITPNMFLVLFNAVYFKGTWVTSFFDQTEDQTFTTLNGEKKTVPMMVRDKVTSWVRESNYTAVELPYEGGASMLLILPDAGQFEAVNKEMTAEKYARIRTKLKNGGGEKTELYLPKFEYKTDTLDLMPAISALGVPDLFKATTNWNPLVGGSEAQVGFLVHKAAITVDQKGTEAAAATGMGMVGSALPSPDAPQPIVFNRPFLLSISDTVANTTLFSGRIGDPSSV